MLPLILSLWGFSTYATTIDSLLRASVDALEYERLTQAKQFAFEALQLAKVQANDSAIAHASYRLANAFQASENFQAASQHYSRAIELADILADSQLLSKALLTQGSMQMKLDQHRDASMSMAHAERISRASEDQYMLMHIGIHKGNLAYETGEYEAASRHFQNAHHLSLEHGNPALRAKLLQNMSEAEAKLLHWEIAERHARAAIAIRLELKNEYWLNKSFENLFFQQLERGDMEALLDSQEEFFHMLHQSGMTTTAEMAEQQHVIMSRLRAWTAEQRKQVIWLWLAAGAVGMIIAGMAIWLQKYRKRIHEQRERLAMRIRQMEMAGERPNVKQRIESLRAHTNPMLAACYLLLGVGYSQAELGRLVGRDRATVHRWINEIGRVLDVEDPRKDASIHLGTEG